MQHKYLWILLLVAMVMGMILWSAGGSRIKDEMPYYLKQIIKETAVIKANGVIIKAEIARTPEAWVKGLSGREFLDTNKGMLFVFPEAVQQTFTMKDMKISLDIVWIMDNKIVYVKHRAQAGLEEINPGVSANYVLEVNGGQADNLQAGDAVEITFDKK